jgi:hypothetical protein
MFWQQGRTHCVQLANPKKRYLKTGKICGFSQNLSFGVFVGNACFLWQTGEFSKKKEKRKLVMIFTNL